MREFKRRFQAKSNIHVVRVNPHFKQVSRANAQLLLIPSNFRLAPRERWPTPAPGQVGAQSRRHIDSWPPSQQTPKGGNPREKYPQQHDDQRDLKPDKSADLPEDKLDSWSPGRRNIVANDLHASLYSALKSRQQFGCFVESDSDKDPSQNDRKNAKRVDFGVMPQS
jgi:RNA recognition motif-containing protein